MDTQETFGENSAGQVGAQLALDKVSDGCALFTGAREKTFEILSDDFVKKRVLRIVTLVFDEWVPERDRVRLGNDNTPPYLLDLVSWRGRSEASLSGGPSPTPAGGAPAPVSRA